jgi:hypothetical protein
MADKSGRSGPENGGLKMRIEHWVEFIYPGIFVSETSERPIEDGQPVVLPDGAFGFRRFTQKVYEARREDGKVLVDRERSAPGPWTYYGTTQTLADVRLLAEANPDRYRILLTNMVNNKRDRVVRTRFGQAIPLGADDVVLPDDR